MRRSSPIIKKIVGTSTDQILETALKKLPEIIETVIVNLFES